MKPWSILWGFLRHRVECENCNLPTERRKGSATEWFWGLIKYLEEFLSLSCGFIFAIMWFNICHLTGYERYAAMRNDPSLCFLERCGQPNQIEIARENSDDFNDR